MWLVRRPRLRMRIMKLLELSLATDSLETYARQLDVEPLILTEDGSPIAALMPIGEADMDTASLADNPKFMAIIEQARAQRRSGLGMSTEQVKRALNIP